MEDIKIINMLFARSEAALSILEEKYGKLCMKIGMNILNNRENAQECFNDTLLGVWNSIPPHRPESLLAYVCKVARNQALKRYSHETAAKRNSHFDASLDELEDCIPSSSTVEEEIEQMELTADLDAFLASLGKADRIIFMRRYYFSDSYAAIADLTGLSEKNVSVKLTRIRAKLKTYLQEKGYTL